jgi:excinuclease UvrABC ATPase subunit
MDVIKLADYIIDIGPEGGKGGGKVVAKGTPEEIADNKKVIPKFLKRIGISIFNYRKFAKLLSFKDFK